MPPVNGAGEPCAGEPHARFEAAGAGNGADVLRHRASPRPYNLLLQPGSWADNMVKPLVDGFFDQENRVHQRLHVLVYPSGVDVSSSTLRFLSQQLRSHRRAIGSRWRRLSAGRQALLTLAHLRMGHTYAQLAAGFSIGTTTAYRYVTEAVGLLAALATGRTK